jgi:hypothetical protein
MRFLLKCASGFLALISPLAAQQAGYVDLISAPALISKPQPHDEGTPAGCSTLGGGFADGFTKPDNGKKTQITLEITKLSSATISAGSEFEAEVRLTNTDSHTIEIPWSTDPATAQAGPDSDHAYYEIGEFQVDLTDSSGLVVPLKSLSSSLLGSRYSTDTQRKIAPGEWITASIKLKVIHRYFGLPTLSDGKARLTAEWQQRGRYWSLNRNKCEVWSGTFLYRNYYEEKSIEALVTINKDAPPDPEVNNTHSKNQELK